jgi:DNA adenine methylase
VHKHAKTLLRYPGGKTRAVKHIVPLLRATGENTLVSPFFGGGAIELALVREGWWVHGYDAWKPVVNFWQAALRDANRVADIADMLRPVSNEAYLAMQRGYGILTCDWTAAAVFYTLNRCVHTGTGLSGGKTDWGNGNPRLNDSTIKKLRSFKAPPLIVEEADFTDSIARHPDSLLYLDPPYVEVGETLYDHSKSGFAHEVLAEMLQSRGKWILSYNNMPLVQELYGGCTFVEKSWWHGSSRRASKDEVVILSPDLKNIV